MARNFLLIAGLLALSILFLSCSEDKSNPTEPTPTTPVIKIISPSATTEIIDSVLVEVEATDDKGITKVEFYVDNVIQKSWSSPPYKYLWNVTRLDDSTQHTIYAKAFDADENKTTTKFAIVTIRLSFVCGRNTLIYEGKTYHTVKIGSQCWLKENLNVGTMIIGSYNQTNNGTIEKYCYNNSEDSCDKYGGLYQWDEAMKYSTTEGARGICPEGWHIPTYEELQTLATAVNQDGNALKEIGQGDFTGVGTNTSGFSALLAGSRDFDGSFKWLNQLSFFWISKEFMGYFGLEASFIQIYGNDNGIGFGGKRQDIGFSVRCVKDW